VGQLSTDLHVVCQFIGKWASGIHFYGQDEYWDILARVFIARCASSFHIFNMLDVILQASGNEEVISHVKIIFGALSARWQLAVTLRIILHAVIIS